MVPGLTEKPSKHKKKNVDNNNINIVEVPKKPTARRHLLLIRHGQYNMDADSDIGRKLTELGRVIWMGQLIIFELFIIIIFIYFRHIIHACTICPYDILKKNSVVQHKS